LHPQLVHNQCMDGMMLCQRLLRKGHSVPEGFLRQVPEWCLK
jgi:hypothetical protein